MQKFFIKLLLLIIVPLLVAEFAVGRIKSLDWFEDHWYIARQSEISKSPDAVILVGTSRTAASVDEKLFAESLQSCLKRPIAVFNMGLGYSTIEEHLLALQRLACKRPGGLKGCTVFVECPLDTLFSTAFVRDEAPEILVRYMTPAAFVQLWSNPGTSGNTKVLVSLAEVSNVFYRYRRIQHYVKKTIERLIGRVCGPGHATESHPVAATEEIAQVGGIRTDAEGVAATRKQVLSSLNEQLDSPRVSDWDAASVGRLARFVAQEGGLVVFFEVPVYRGPTKSVAFNKWCEEKVGFLAASSRWGDSYLHNTLSTTAADFPDLLHLAATKRPDFTHALVEESLKAGVFSRDVKDVSEKSDECPNVQNGH